MSLLIAVTAFNFKCGEYVENKEDNPFLAQITNWMQRPITDNYEFWSEAGQCFREVTASTFIPAGSIDHPDFKNLHCDMLVVYEVKDSHESITHPAESILLKKEQPTDEQKDPF